METDITCTISTFLVIRCPLNRRMYPSILQTVFSCLHRKFTKCHAPQT